MGMFSGINSAATGMSAQRIRLDVIANNIANANSTRTDEGGVFRRSRVIVRPRVRQAYWRSPFLPPKLDNGIGKGVMVDKIEEDMDTEIRLIWDPTHPDAMKTGKNTGYVEYPNVSIVSEMVDMIDAQRSYEANMASMNGSKSMFQKSLEIIA